MTIDPALFEAVEFRAQRARDKARDARTRQTERAADAARDAARALEEAVRALESTRRELRDAEMQLAEGRVRAAASAVQDAMEPLRKIYAAQGVSGATAQNAAREASQERRLLASATELLKRLEERAALAAKAQQDAVSALETALGELSKGVEPAPEEPDPVLDQLRREVAERTARVAELERAERREREQIGKGGDAAVAAFEPFSRAGELEWRARAELKLLRALYRKRDTALAEARAALAEALAAAAEIYEVHGLADKRAQLGAPPEASE